MADGLAVGGPERGVSQRPATAGGGASSSDGQLATGSRANRSPGAVLHLPLGDDIDNTPVMVQSLEHRRPIVNGYSGQRPAFFPALVESLADFPSRDSLAAIRELDVRFVVAPAPVAGAGNAALTTRRARALRRRRDLRSALDAGGDRGVGRVVRAATATAGEPLFAAGESATYDIYWDGGPLNIAAGSAVLRVLEGSAADPRWRFEVQAETADWVSRFFQRPRPVYDNRGCVAAADRTQP